MPIIHTWNTDQHFVLINLILPIAYNVRSVSNISLQFIQKPPVSRGHLCSVGLAIVPFCYSNVSWAKDVILYYEILILLP